jgi:hypothetical protein
VSAPKEFARSANGDVWLLGRDGSDIPYVIHQANLPSGGVVTKMDVAAFLKQEPDHPESLELIRLMGTAANAAQPEPKPPATEPITQPGKRPVEDPPDSGPVVPTPPDSPPAKEPPTQPGGAPIEDPPIGPDTI